MQGLFNNALTSAARWIAVFPWCTTAQVRHLTDTLRNGVPQLRAPAVAASVLRKDSIDPMCTASDGLVEVLRLVHTCFGEQPASYEASPVFAVRVWFKRRHGGPDTEGVGLLRILAALDELNSLLSIPCFARDAMSFAGELDFIRTAGDRRYLAHFESELARLVHGPRIRRRPPPPAAHPWLLFDL